MASVYFEDLTCSVCLTLFTDPVTLLCGHSFCRLCITTVLNTQQTCPHCRTDISTDVTSLPTSLVLKRLAEKAQEPDRRTKEPAADPPEVADLCPEHEEKLKLFCLTDQQLACIICRDCERHEGHRFKPIKEAAASLRKELETFIQRITDDVHAIESLTNTQKGEISKTKAKSEQLMSQINRQFQEIHQFLRNREDEIKRELKRNMDDSIAKMSKASEAAETVLSETRELMGRMQSVLEITDSEKFLKNWTDSYSELPDLFRHRANEVQVVNASLFLGPYESHLQFFVWKEMLQVVQPKPELLTLNSTSSDVVVSDDKQCLFTKPKRNQTQQSFGMQQHFVQDEVPFFGQPSRLVFGRKDQRFHQPLLQPVHQTLLQPVHQPVHQPLLQPVHQPVHQPLLHAFSVEEFTSGQHYWEIQVGTRDYWELGIKNNVLKYSEGKYETCGPNITTEIDFFDKPQKIGVYMDCSTGQLSFYNADNMTHIHTMTAAFVSMPGSACINFKYYKDPDYNPVMVCWY